MSRLQDIEEMIIENFGHLFYPKPGFLEIWMEYMLLKGYGRKNDFVKTVVFNGTLSQVVIAHGLGTVPSSVNVCMLDTGDTSLNDNVITFDNQHITITFISAPIPATIRFSIQAFAGGIDPNP